MRSGYGPVWWPVGWPPWVGVVLVVALIVLTLALGGLLHAVFART